MTTIGYATLAIVPSLRGVSASIDKQLKDIDTGSSKAVGSRIGKALGEGVVANAALSGKGAGKKLVDDFEADAHPRAARAGAAIGSAIGKSVGAGLKLGIAGAAASATAAVAGIGITLKKGFDRLESIDQATFKLKALGHSADETKQIMDNALASVKGTSFNLADAATAAASAVAAGIKPGQDLTKYLGEVGDAAAVAGSSFEEMGSIFNKIQTSNKAYTDDLNQLADRGLPIFKWLQDEYGVTGDKLSEMVEKGEVDSAHFQDAIDKNIGGAALKMGESFDGAVDKLEASVARLGANFITSILGGDPATALQGPTEAIGNLTTKFDDIGKWVQAHSGEIRQFFLEMVNDAKNVFNQIKSIIETLGGLRPAIEGVVIAFAAWKGISGVVSLASDIGKVSAALSGVGGAASAAGAAGAAGLAPLSAAISSILGALGAIAGGGAIGGAAFNNAVAAAGGPNSPGGRNALNQEFSPGFGIPGAVNAPIFQPKKDYSKIPTAPYVPTGATSGSLGNPNGVIGGGAAGYVPPTPGGYLIPGKKTLFGNSYDGGGVLPPGLTLANNKTGQEEYVLTPEQIEWLKQNGIDPASIKKDSPPPGGAGGITLPSSFSGLATSPFDAMTAAGKANSGPGHRDPMAYFPDAASKAIGGQISSALGVAGITDAPPFLQAASQFFSGVSIGGDAGSSAAPTSATPRVSGASLPDAVHSGTGQAPGPQTVINWTVNARDTEEAFLRAQRFQDQRTAAKLSAY